MRRRQLLPYFLMAGLSSTAMGGIFTLLGELRDELGFSETGLGVMVAMSFFAAFLTQVSVARFADRGHAATLIRAGLVAIVAGLVAMSVADELWTFVIARSVMGVGVGALLPSVRRLVIVADADNIGTNVGTLGAFDVAGFMLGPALAGVIADQYGFRAPFVVLAVILVALSPVAFRLPPDAGEQTSERRVVRVLLANRGVRAMLVVTAGWYAMIGVFEVVWSVMLTDLGAGTSTIGLGFTLILAPMVVLAPLTGNAAERWGPLRLVGFSVAMVGLISIAYGSVDSIALLIVIATAQGLFDAVAFPGSQVGIAMAARDDLAASAQGLQGAALQLSAGATALVAGFSYEEFGRATVFTSLAVVLVMGVIVSAWIARPLIEAGDELVFGRRRPVKV